MAAQPTDYAYQQRLGERIRTARQRSGLTQKQTASLTEVREHTLRRWEQGLHAPKFPNVVKLAATLGVPVASLLTDTPGQACVAEVMVSADTLRKIRSKGRKESQAVAARLATALEPLLWRAARQPLPAGPNGSRAKPRRTREQIVAGTAQAKELHAVALARFNAQTARTIQAGGGDDGDGG